MEICDSVLSPINQAGQHIPVNQGKLMTSLLEFDALIRVRAAAVWWFIWWLLLTGPPPPIVHVIIYVTPAPH